MWLQYQVVQQGETVQVTRVEPDHQICVLEQGMQSTKLSESMHSTCRPQQEGFCGRRMCDDVDVKG